MDAIGKLKAMEPESLDFSQLEEVFSQCRDIFDTTLMIAAGDLVWNGRVKGLETYVKRNGFNDPNLLKFVVAIVAYYKVISAHSARSYLSILGHHYSWFIRDCILGMWESIRTFDLSELEKILEDNSQLALWAEIFKLYCISWSRVGRGLAFDMSRYRTHSKTWKEACHYELPGPEHAKFRDGLFRLEDIHGDAIRECFPPEEV